MRSDYTLTHLESPTADQPGFIGLIDEDAGSKSVTNDAENVILDLAKTYPLDRYIVLYRDSMDRWDRMLTQRGQFLGFAPLGAKTFEEAKARSQGGPRCITEAHRGR